MTTPDELFEDTENYRAVLSTETDDGSPDNENTYGAIRNCIETLTMHSGGKVATMTLTSDPSNSNSGVATDTGQSMTATNYIGFLAIVLDGDGIGNIFYIQDNAATTITCYTDLQGGSGGINPNLYSAGIRAGDKIGIFYHFMTANHDHNGKNSAPFASPDGYSTICAYPQNPHIHVAAYIITSHYSNGPEFMIYIPSNASVLHVLICIQKEGVHASHQRFVVYSHPGGVHSGTSDSVSRSAAGTVWLGPMRLNCSGLAEGYYKVIVQGRTDHSSSRVAIVGATLGWHAT